MVGTGATLGYGYDELGAGVRVEFLERCELTASHTRRLVAASFHQRRVESFLRGTHT